VSDPVFVGVNPWLPYPLSRSRWWTEPVRAERWAAFRIALAAALLLDILASYLPIARDLFGPNSLGSPDAFADRSEPPNLYWSLLRGIDSSAVLTGVLIGWAAAACSLLVGFCSCSSAAVCWALAISFLNLNFFAHNAGDTVKVIGLFYLMLSPCGAVWSVDAKLARRRGPVFISPWPLRLLFVQLAAIYFFSGVQKLAAPDWRSGDTLHYILADPALARWPYAQQFIPYWLTRLATWTVLAWEIGFPLLVAMPALRKWALGMGVAFHVGLGLTTELGMFPIYALTLYVPLLPWEKWRGRAAPCPPAPSGYPQR